MDNSSVSFCQQQPHNSMWFHHGHIFDMLFYLCLSIMFDASLHSCKFQGKSQKELKMAFLKAGRMGMVDIENESHWGWFVLAPHMMREVKTSHAITHHNTPQDFRIKSSQHWMQGYRKQHFFLFIPHEHLLLQNLGFNRIQYIIWLFYVDLL